MRTKPTRVRDPEKNPWMPLLVEEELDEAREARRRERAERRREREREPRVDDPFPTTEREVSAIVPILWLLVPLVLIIVWALIDAYG